MLVVTGEGIGVGDCVLVIGEGILLPSALALTLRLTPTLLQICFAKARTSGGKIPVSQSTLLETFILPSFRGDHRACTFSLDLGDGDGEERLRGGNTHSANQPASTVSLLRLGLR